MVSVVKEIERFNSIGWQSISLEILLLVSQSKLTQFDIVILLRLDRTNLKRLLSVKLILSTIEMITGLHFSFINLR